MSRKTIYLKEGTDTDLEALAAIKQISVSELISQLVEKAVKDNHAAIAAYKEQLKAIQAKLKK